MPRLSIDWYKKAMNKPMLLNGATIFGSDGNHLLGGGEAGPEVIMGLDALRDMAASPSNELASVMNSVIAILNEYLPQLANMSVLLDSGEMVGAMAPAMDAQLGVLAARKKTGVVRMYHSMTIGEKHTFRDFGLIPVSRPVVNPPQPNYSFLEVPGANGSLDISEAVCGNITYADRTGSFEFYVKNGRNWVDVYRRNYGISSRKAADRYAGR